MFDREGARLGGAELDGARAREAHAAARQIGQIERSEIAVADHQRRARLDRCEVDSVEKAREAIAAARRYQQRNGGVGRETMQIRQPQIVAAGKALLACKNTLARLDLPSA